MSLQHILESSERFRKYGEVEWNSALSWVSITADGEDDIFMQGDEASQFIDQLDALCEAHPTLNFYDAACHLAEPYAETLWS